MATDGHPFWAPERAEWVDAIDLTPGTWLRTSAGTWAQISAVATGDAPDQRVHNLTVAGLNTYYIGADDVDVLVSNSNQCDDDSPSNNQNGSRPYGSENGARELADRALEIQARRDNRDGTVAAVRVYNHQTGESEVWVATERNSRRNDPGDPEWYPADLDLRDGERYINGDGHAEQTIIDATRSDPNYDIIEGGTNRNICLPGESSTGACMPEIDAEGLEHGGDYRRGTTYKSGERHFWWDGEGE